MSKITFNIGDLVEFQRNVPLSIRDDNTNEYFNVGDLFLVVDVDALVENYPKQRCYHFISAKTGSSIFWDREDLEDYGPLTFFKKVEV